MGNYWKRRFFQERRKMLRRRRQMKIALGIMITLALIFGTLFMIGYTGKQMATTASQTANSFYIQLVNEINAIQNAIASIIIAIIVILVFLFFIWMMIPKTETTSYGGGY